MDEEAAAQPREEVDVEIDEAEANPEPIPRPGRHSRILASARFWSHRLRLATTAAGLVSYRHLPESLCHKLDEASASANNSSVKACRGNVRAS